MTWLLIYAVVGALFGIDHFRFWRELDKGWAWRALGGLWVGFAWLPIVLFLLTRPAYLYLRERIG